MNAAPTGAWSVHCGDWIVGSASRTGTHHPLCEDAALAHFPASGGLHLSLADGVSRGDAGHVAAQRLVRHCVGLPASRVHDHACVARWVEAGDQAVAQAVVGCGHRRGAACMAAAWLDASGQGCLSHVGDCRIYLWRVANDATIRMEALTRDQSFLHLGEVPPPGVGSMNPARMVGSGSVGRARVRGLRLRSRMGLLMCSDGVHDVMDAAGLTRALAQAMRNEAVGHEALKAASRSIADECARQGSEDDICVVLAWRQAGETS